MKKLFLILSLAFIMFSCDDKPVEETNPFIGTWEDKDDYLIEQYIFTKDFEFTRTVQMLAPEDEQYNETNTGTYEFDDQIICFYHTSPSILTVRAGYLLDNKTLIMMFGSARIYSYKKIK